AVSAPVASGLSVVASAFTSGTSYGHRWLRVCPLGLRVRRDTQGKRDTMPSTVILSAARTPIGKLGGGLASVDATELGGTAIRAALERAEVEPDQIQHVIMGQVLQAGQGQIPSRQAQIKGGIPKEISSETINKVCASGIRSACLLDNAIRVGDLDVAVAGGM